MSTSVAKKSVISCSNGSIIFKVLTFSFLILLLKLLNLNN